MEYYTHDNTNRSYCVVVFPEKISIYTISNVNKVDRIDALESRLHDMREKEKKMKKKHDRNPHKENSCHADKIQRMANEIQTLRKFDVSSTDVPLMEVQAPLRVFIGENPPAYNSEPGKAAEPFYGNSFLIHCESKVVANEDEEPSHTYLFVGQSIHKFTTTERIGTFISPVDKEDIPSPYGISENYYYFMVDGVSDGSESGSESGSETGSESGSETGSESGEFEEEDESEEVEEESELTTSGESSCCSDADNATLCSKLRTTYRSSDPSFCAYDYFIYSESTGKYDELQPLDNIVQLYGRI